MIKKRGIKAQVVEALPWIIIAVVALVIFMVVILVQKQSGASLIDKIKNLFSGR